MKKNIFKGRIWMGSGLALVVLLLFMIIWGTGFFQKMTYQRHLSLKEKLGGRIYYLSPDGDDQYDGSSPATAWKTLDRLNDVNFSPGDRILLEGGRIFKGTLFLDGKDLGSGENPIFIGSYGADWALIDAGHNDGIAIKNAAGYHIIRLKIRGSGREVNRGSGIKIYNNYRGGFKMDCVLIDSVEVSGFGKFGILLKSERSKSGYRNVKITNSEVHDNADAGLYIYGYFNHKSAEYAHENVVVRYVKAYNNSGRPGPELENTGSGIVISDVDGGLIERCVAYQNGWLCESTQGGPVGIWAWDSRNVTIQYNEAYRNRTNGDKDGGGFDLDGGCTNSVMQYNYSHDNDGAGYLLAQFPYAREFKNNIVRYNISQNDSRKNNTAAIYFWGDIQNTLVYNNTVYLEPSPQSRPAAVAFKPNLIAPSYQKPLPSETYFYNNIFITTGNLSSVRILDSTENTVFHHNNYYSPDSSLTFQWLDSVFHSLSAWRDISHQEKENNQLYGYSVDPVLTSPGMGPTLGSADSLISLHAYDLLPSSPMIDSGLDIGKIHQTETSFDFRGNKVPQNGAIDLGAIEFTPMILSPY